VSFRGGKSVRGSSADPGRVGPGWRAASLKLLKPPVKLGIWQILNLPGVRASPPE
jgi:hypothetical protein